MDPRNSSTPFAEPTATTTGRLERATRAYLEGPTSFVCLQRQFADRINLDEVALVMVYRLGGSF